MVSFTKSATFDCHEPLVVAAFWAAGLGSNVDEDSTPDRAWVEPAGWGGPSLWFMRVPEQKTAKNRQHFDLRPTSGHAEEVHRLVALGAGEIAVMVDPEGKRVLRRMRRRHGSSEVRLCAHPAGPATRDSGTEPIRSASCSLVMPCNLGCVSTPRTN